MSAFVRRALLVALAGGLLAAGCSKKDAPPPAEPGDDAGTKTSHLAIEIRGTIDVTMKISGDVLDVDLAARDADFSGFFAAEEKLHAKGRVERFPESQLTLYTGLVSLPARPASPCATQPITMALSLSQRGDDARVGGGLTVYCGDRAVGVPKRLFRITGRL